jgi:hypothetical protein
LGHPEKRIRQEQHQTSPTQQAQPASGGAQASVQATVRSSAPQWPQNRNAGPSTDRAANAQTGAPSQRAPARPSHSAILRPATTHARAAPEIPSDNLDTSPDPAPRRSAAARTGAPQQNSSAQSSEPTSSTTPRREAVHRVSPATSERSSTSREALRNSTRAVHHGQARPAGELNPERPSDSNRSRSARSAPAAEILARASGQLTRLTRRPSIAASSAGLIGPRTQPALAGGGRRRSDASTPYDTRDTPVEPVLRTYRVPEISPQGHAASGKSKRGQRGPGSPGLPRSPTGGQAASGSSSRLTRDSGPFVESSLGAGPGARVLEICIETGFMLAAKDTRHSSSNLNSFAATLAENYNAQKPRSLIETGPVIRSDFGQMDSSKWTLMVGYRSGANYSPEKEGAPCEDLHLCSS